MCLTKDTIKDVFLDENNKIIPSRTNINYIKKHGYYDFLINYYDDSESLLETIYRICYSLDERPVCKHCGSKLKFNHRFLTFCSKKCSNHDEDVLQRNKDNVSKSLKKSYKERGDEIKEKRKNSLKEKYGVDVNSPFQIDEIQKKAQESVFERYGVTNVFYIPEKRVSSDYFRNKSILLQKERGYDIEYVKNDYGDYDILVHNGCKKHGDIIIPAQVFNNRTRENDRIHNTILCLECNPLRNKETMIETIIKNILEELGINYIQHDRTKIKPFELDFYVDDYKIAIECNGIFWHKGENNKYRLLKKMKMCQEKGINLLYFWEDEILDKTDIVKSYLKSVFQKNEKIYARNCVLKEITSKESSEFLKENHLQSNINSSYRYGLFYKDELVEVMTFGKLRKCNGSKSENGVFELYRLCSKKGYTIVGGASKLLKYFEENVKPNRIITYNSIDISCGSVYEKLGFNYVCDTEQGYFYVNSRTHERRGRFSFRKDVIDDKSGRTANEIAESMNWFRCYNCGNKKYEKIL